MTTPHQSPYISYDAETLAAHERYRASLDRARQQRPIITDRKLDNNSWEQCREDVPPFDWRELLRLQARMFVRSALAMGAVVAVLLALFWIGGGR